jgi:hypothetical protein
MKTNKAIVEANSVIGGAQPYCQRPPSRCFDSHCEGALRSQPHRPSLTTHYKLPTHKEYLIAEMRVCEHMGWEAQQSLRHIQWAP